MWIILLEAALALGLAAFIVWWTMFSGRRPEHHSDQDPEDSSGAGRQ
ncbi:hypothetical protein [Inhella gelatinilytica]|uniref:Uncharacterized protein n=1 Tax=Inhella gelatinilytica TaxID=2795030 RepID=A0A931IVH8_9BURK|nr:hypothetical protein [Inhella gelatinilytica]MBH9553570.1 hypothetical protein [Inhella gelatinilytica]